MYGFDEAAPVLLQLTDERPICGQCGGREDSECPEFHTDPDGSPICDDCFDDACFTCYQTDEIGWRDDAVTGPDGNLYCERWARDNIGTCEDCDDATWCDDEVYVDNHGPVCRSCYEESYFCCDGCHETIHNDDYGSDGMCTRCEPDEESCDLIRDYSNQDANHLGFFGDTKDGIFYGVELEVECPNGDRAEHAETVQDALGDDFAVLKEDGSLSTGFEIVTAPATVQEHTERFKDLMTSGKTRGLKSWDTSTCGMHVHVSRKPLSGLTIGKILVWMNDPANQDLVSQVAGRSNTRWSKVCDKKLTDGHARNRRSGSNADRYTAVNVSGSNTIEFRIFKGTLKYESFLKNLEFVRSVVTFCRSAGIQEVTQEHYLRHVSSRRKDYPHLVAFLRERNYLPTPARCKSFQSAAK